MKRWLSLILAAALAVCVFAACSKDDNTSDSAGKHHVEIEVQDYGTIAVELDGDAAPITVDNFLKLAKEGFYDGLTFHRIIDGFMIQGGDPEGTGMGGSDETIKGEFSANGVENNLSHTRGAISMARNSVSMDSASSQFFIVQSDSTFLDGQYACFGYVTSGMDIVDQICKDAQPTDGNGTIPAAEQRSGIWSRWPTRTSMRKSGRSGTWPTCRCSRSIGSSSSSRRRRGSSAWCRG